MAEELISFIRDLSRITFRDSTSRKKNLLAQLIIVEVKLEEAITVMPLWQLCAT